MQISGDWVLPDLSTQEGISICRYISRSVASLSHHGQDLNLTLLPRRKLIVWKLVTLVLDAQAGWQSTGGRHPDIRMRCILDLRADGNRLELLGEDIEHCPPTHEGRCAEGYRELVTGAIIVSNDLRLARRDLNPIQRRDLGWREVVQRCIDMPAVESRVSLRLVLLRHARLMEGRMRRVLEHCLREALVVVDRAVAYQLDLRHTRDRLEIRVEHGLLLGARLVVPVPVALAGGIEGLYTVQV